MRIARFAFFMAIASTSAAHAAGPDQAREACRNVATLAGSIMEARQRDAPMAEVMAAAEDVPAEARPLARSMVTDAYVVPREADKAARDKAVQTFQTDYYSSCYAELTKQ